MPTNRPLLTLRSISKDYVTRVLSAVDFEVHAGEIHALLVNGAGKSTLCKIVAGLILPTDGTMSLDNAPYRPTRKGQAERCGVQIVQQELNLIPTLSVAENLFLNCLPQRWGCLQFGVLRRKAEAALQRVGLHDVDPRTPVASLGVGTRQLIEIAAALVRDCRVLILDEPTGATSREIELLFQQLLRLRSSGVGIIYVSHRLEEIRQISDRLTVLRDGRLVETRDAADDGK